MNLENNNVQPKIPNIDCGCNKDESKDKKIAKETSNFKRNLSRILLGFAIFSAGFALGKNSVVKKNQRIAKTEISEAKKESTPFVTVYYMHSTFRCKTCNHIENLTKNLVNTKFKQQLENGKVTFKSVNYQEDQKLAKKFEIVSNCVVIANNEPNGNIKNFIRLDEVWTKMKNEKQFDKYLSDPINKYLKEVK